MNTPQRIAGYVILNLFPMRTTRTTLKRLSIDYISHGKWGFLGLNERLCRKPIYGYDDDNY